MNNLSNLELTSNKQINDTAQTQHTTAQHHHTTAHAARAFMGELVVDPTLGSGGGKASRGSPPPQDRVPPG